MRTFPVLLLAIALSTVAIACSEGGGGDAEIASVIHRLLQSSTSDQGGELETFVGELPDGLAVEPPLYPDAELIVSSRQAAATATTPTPDASGNMPQPVLYLIVLDTNDSRSDVYEFYEDALDADPWRVDSAFSATNIDTMQFSNVNDADITGVVTVARGGDDDRTSVLISLQDAGAFRQQLPRFELPDSVPVPGAFPPDIPTYEGATVTGSAFVREPAAESFLLVFLTRDRRDEVLAFYRTEFQQYGWTVQEGEPIGIEQETNFRDPTGAIQGTLLMDAFARDQRYTEVNVQFRQNPGRAPASASDTTSTPPAPTPAATRTAPQPTAAVTP